MVGLHKISALHSLGDCSVGVSAGLFLPVPFVEVSSMKLLIGLAAIVGLSAVSAMAGEGRLSNQSLAKIGLVGMKIMSDSQGLEIRGLGVTEGSGRKRDDHHKDDHHQRECDKCHERQCHEKESCHPHESCCHPSCHLESLCQVHCAGRAG
jgi:hypothetical protein